MSRREEILRICSVNLRGILAGIEGDFADVQEIRLRAGQPLMMRTEEGEFYIGKRGEKSRRPEMGYRVPAREIKEMMEYVGNYSLYAYEEELRQGYLTVQGGHRVGVAGKVVPDQGRIKTIKYISFLHIRVAHEKKGCADRVLPWLYDQDRGRWYHSLIVSPPGCGKTTLLRDLIRQISDGTVDGTGQAVGVVDERSELAACYMGIPQNDLGRQTDVLDGCPKAEGMMLLLRSMSPRVLAVDEVGGQADQEAVRYAMDSGCCVLATAHGSCMEEIRRKWQRVGMEQLMFERYIFLSRGEGAGTMEEIRDENGQILYRRKGDAGDVVKTSGNSAGMGGMYRSGRMPGG